MEMRPRGREKPRPSDKTWIAVILVIHWVQVVYKAKDGGILYTVNDC